MLKKIIDSNYYLRNNALIFVNNVNDIFISPDDGIFEAVPLKYALFNYLGSLKFDIAYIDNSGFTPVFPPTTDRKNSTFNKPTGDFLENTAIYINQVLNQLKSSNDVKKVLIINAIDLLLPDADASNIQANEANLIQVLVEATNNSNFRRSGNMVILLTTANNPSQILTRSGAFTKVNIELPDYNSRLNLINFFNTVNVFKNTFNSKINNEELARLTSGMQNIYIEKLFRYCTHKQTEINHIDIIRFKERSIENSFCETIEFKFPEKTIDEIIGLNHLKDHMLKEKYLLDNDKTLMSSTELWLGVPGVGKTHSVEAYANLLGFSFYSLRNVRDKYVGESEKKMELVSDFIKNQENFILFMDEIDQVFNRGSNDGNGVDNRLFAQLLMITGDNSRRGKSKIIFASNRVDLLDSALINRLSNKIVFLTPSLNERVILFKNFLSEYNKKNITNTLNDSQLFTLSSNPKLAFTSVRELIDICIKIVNDAYLQNRSIDYNLCDTVINYFNSTNTNDYEYIALLSIANLKFADQLPWNASKPFDYNNLPNYLHNLVNDDGTIKTAEFNQRLNELQQIRR